MTPWTRLEDSVLWRAAQQAYATPRRAYHNFDHPRRMYRHAAETFGFAYDPELDRAILGHDAREDGKPYAEIRSNAWLQGQLPEVDAGAGRQILKTVTHDLSDDNRLILLDFADFLDPQQTRINTGLLRREARETKGWSDEIFTLKTQRFLTGMAERIAVQSAGLADPQERAWWTGIRAGALQALSELSEPSLQSIHF